MFLAGYVFILNLKQVAQRHLQRGNSFLAEFCQRHIFGYKLAACLLESSQSRVLYSDADVLWFSDPSITMKEYCKLPIYAACDPLLSCDVSLLHIAEAYLGLSFRDPPFVNAGIAIYNSDPTESQNIDFLLARVLEKETIDNFSEQTIVTILARTVGGLIDSKDVFVGLADTINHPPSYFGTDWVARHYIRPARHLFWSDCSVLFDSSLSRFFSGRIRPYC